MPTDLPCGCRIGPPKDRLCSYHEGYEDGRPDWLDRLIERAHDWRISDEYLGNLFRSKVGRQPNDTDNQEPAGA